MFFHSVLANFAVMMLSIRFCLSMHVNLILPNGTRIDPFTNGKWYDSDLISVR